MLFTCASIIVVLTCAGGVGGMTIPTRIKFEDVPVERSRVYNRKDNEGATMYHQHLTRLELADIFGVNHHDNIPKYYPAFVRGIQNPKEDEYHVISVNVLGKEMNIKLSKNVETIPETHTTEFVAEDGTSTKYKGILGEFSRGYVLEDEDSHAAFHHTGRGISGSIRTNNDMLIIKPLPKRVVDDEANHIVYRLMDLPARHNINQYVTRRDSNGNDTTKSKRRRRRSIDNTFPKKYMELMIVADWKMLEFYTQDVLPQYMLNVGNIVSGMFLDSSLEYPLNIIITRTVIFKTDVLQAANTGDQLDKFTKWVQENNDFSNDADPEHVDAAILMSRNGCVGGTVCGIEGLANVNMCGSSATGVSRDRGLMSATTIAHEVGHIINAEHDSGDACPSGTYIMSSGSTAGGEKSFEWSTCSSNTFKADFESEDSKCFDDVPAMQLNSPSFQLYGQVYNATTQCKFTYGSDYRECAPYESRCDFLFCRYKDAMQCERLSYASVHGTKCGTRMWCIKGHCLPDGTPPPKVVNGNWGAWSDYTSCSRPCGAGIQWKVRTCNDPEPLNGGLWCDPEATIRTKEKDHYRSCNTQNCIKNTETNEKYASGTMHGSSLEDRNQLCKKLNSADVFCTYCQPHINPCDLVCGSTTSGVLEGFVQDGTACVTKTYNEAGMCIHGECVEYGCDLEIYSAVQKDRCGKCGGNGDFCKPMHGQDPTSKFILGKTIIAHIPAGSTEVEIHETTATKNFLGFSYAGSDVLLMYIPTYSKSITIDGITIEYIMNGFVYPDKLVFHGKLPKPMTIWLCNYYDGVENGIEWNYVKNLEIAEKLGATQWKSSDWHACSKTCGHEGIQRRDVHCEREDGSSVHPSKCPLASNPALIQVCNRVDCAASWVRSDWSDCSKKCATGKRTRTIKCIVASKDGVNKVVTESECSYTKPSDPTEEVCNAIDCDPRWVIKGDFSPCSESCGGGVMSRPVHCWRVHKDGEDHDEEDYACEKLPEAKPATTESCNTDELCPTWVVKYAACSVTCGTGVQTVVGVVCASDTEEFADTRCNGDKPTGVAKTCGEDPCTTFAWDLSNGECSEPCGGGEVTETPVCKKVETQTIVVNTECDASTKPSATTKACNPDECPKEHIWKLENSECSVVCGPGEQIATAHCVKKSTGEKVADIDCDPASKPTSITTACNLKTCASYHWVKKSSCSISCGEGIEEATAKCIDISNNEVSDEECDSSVKPTYASTSCNLGVCPPEPTYSWRTRDSGCSVTCGKGKHDFVIECIEQSGEVIKITDPERCDASAQPAAPVKLCEKPSCFQLSVYHGRCDSPCGHKIRELRCVLVKTKEIVEFANCQDLPDTDDTNQAHDCEGNCPVSIPGYDYYPLGCFQDSTTQRAIPHYLGNYRDTIDWTDMAATVKKCFDKAKETPDTTFVAVQFYGECWSGTELTSREAYHEYGKSTNCYIPTFEAGVGGSMTNFVYHFHSPITSSGVGKPLAAIILGCYQDNTPGTAVSLESWDVHMQMCTIHALNEGLTVFGMKSDGTCLGEAVATDYLEKDDFSLKCMSAEGLIEQYFVYKFHKFT